MIKNIFFILLSFAFFGCYTISDTLSPRISCNLDEEYIKNLKNPFSDLEDQEKKQDWAKEYIIAKKFAEELDLYRAITNFKRAKILMDKENTNRLQEIEYSILLCYYFAKKYDDVIDSFEKSTLSYVDKSFAAFEDLLIVLYESYRQIEDTEKTEAILELIEKHYPRTEKTLEFSTALLDANLEKIQEYANLEDKKEYLSELNLYKQQKKSVAAAQVLNAVMPGAGYLYIGQSKSALTSFMLNGLFIYASYEFLKRGYTAAGLITISFETGWYFGGIYGAGEEAKYYNEKVYESLTKPVMNKDKTFPMFMLKYGF